MRLGAARRDWLHELRLLCSIMLMRLQELCKTCASSYRVPVVLFQRKVTKFLHNSCAILVDSCYFILLQNVNG